LFSMMEGRPPCRPASEKRGQNSSLGRPGCCFSVPIAIIAVPIAISTG
jgi:hypothetical protein